MKTLAVQYVARLMNEDIDSTVVGLMKKDIGSTVAGLMVFIH
jgi:hypothetical protein